jgi:membrane fusion protein (multidrug efflux system)
MPRTRSFLTLLAAASVAVLLSACSGDDAAAPGAEAGGPPAMPPSQVEAVIVQAEPLHSGLSTVGTLRADESVVMRPEVAGRLVRIHFEEGQRIERGAPMFSLDASSAQAGLSEARANLENARRANARATDLGGQQLLSKSEVDRARAELGVAEARVASAQAVAAKTALVAPFSGIAGLREVSVGEVVSPGQALVNLVRLDPMEVDFSLPESQLGQVSVGQPVSVSVDAFAGETFTGEVAAIEPVIDIASRSAKLRARIANPGYRLRPGQFARVTIGTGDAAGTALMIPEQALMQEGDVRFVYVVRDGKAVRTEITTGQRVPGRIEVVQGLAAGDQVISAGQAKPMMFDGAPVVVVAAPGEQAAPAAGDTAVADGPEAAAAAGPADADGE